MLPHLDDYHVFLIAVNAITRLLFNEMFPPLGINIWLNVTPRYCFILIMFALHGILMVHGKITDEWHTDDIRVHRVTYGWHTSTYYWHMDDIRVRTSDIRVHTSDIRMTYEHIQVTYGWHASTYEWHTDDTRVHIVDIRVTYEYIRVT